MTRSPDKQRSEPTRKDEATALTKEALEEIRQGEKEDGQFVLDEARKLDPDAVEQALRRERG
jgi:hypothetical protein